MSFDLIVMGCTGGPKESNLSGYLLAPAGSESYITLDAGTLIHGVEIAASSGALPFKDDPILTPAGAFLRDGLKALLVSHAHLDHIAALVINSQVHGQKPLYGTDPTIDALRDHIFNGVIWPNYGSEGAGHLDRLLYQRLGWEAKVPIKDTPFTVETYRLSHPGDYPSCAFLLEAEGNYVLYCGDTSADCVENEKRLATLWKRVAPLIQEGKLKALMIECSHPEDDDADMIFGHLNPSLLLEELQALYKLTGESLKQVKILVTHRKETLRKVPDVKALIAEEVTRDNSLGLHFIFPRQGERFSL